MRSPIEKHPRLRKPLTLCAKLLVMTESIISLVTFIRSVLKQK
jgi:hypothetical protein